MSQSLNVVSNLLATRTVDTRDPQINLPCGKRTDELDTESLRKELLNLPVPILPAITQTEGRADMLQKLVRHISTRRVIDWTRPNPNE